MASDRNQTEFVHPEVAEYPVRRTLATQMCVSVCLSPATRLFFSRHESLVLYVESIFLHESKGTQGSDAHEDDTQMAPRYGLLIRGTVL